MPTITAGNENEKSSLLDRISPKVQYESMEHPDVNDNATYPYELASNHVNSDRYEVEASNGLVVGNIQELPIQPRTCTPIIPLFPGREKHTRHSDSGESTDQGLSPLKQRHIQLDNVILDGSTSPYGTPFSDEAQSSDDEKKKKTGFRYFTTSRSYSLCCVVHFPIFCVRLLFNDSAFLPTRGKLRERARESFFIYCKLMNILSRQGCACSVLIFTYRI